MHSVFHSIRFKVNKRLEYGGTPFFVPIRLCIPRWASLLCQLLQRFFQAVGVRRARRPAWHYAPLAVDDPVRGVAADAEHRLHGSLLRLRQVVVYAVLAAETEAGYVGAPRLVAGARAEVEVDHVHAFERLLHFRHVLHLLLARHAPRSPHIDVDYPAPVWGGYAVEYLLAVGQRGQPGRVGGLRRLRWRGVGIVGKLLVAGEDVVAQRGRGHALLHHGGEFGREALAHVLEVGDEEPRKSHVLGEAVEAHAADDAHLPLGIFRAEPFVYGRFVVECACGLEHVHVLLVVPLRRVGRH